MAEEVTASIEITTTSEPKEEATLEKIFLTTILLLESVTAMTLDALCVVAIMKRRLHKEENRFIFMTVLALAEMLVALSFAVQFITGENYLLLNLLILFELGDIGCALLNCASTFAICMAMLALLLLTTDQYLRIEFSLKYPTFATRRNAFIQISVAFAFVIFDVLLLIWVLSTNSGQQCSITWNFPPWYYIYGCLAYVLLPLSLIALMNGRIWYLSFVQQRNLKKMQPVSRVQSHTNNHGVHGSGDATERSSQGPNRNPPSSRHWKTTVTVAILVGSLVLCWTPMTLSMALSVFEGVDFSQATLGFCAMISMVNYLITPAVYIIRIPEVKSELKGTLQICH